MPSCVRERLAPDEPPLCEPVSSTTKCSSVATVRGRASVQPVRTLGRTSDAQRSSAPAPPTEPVADLLSRRNPPVVDLDGVVRRTFGWHTRAVDSLTVAMPYLHAQRRHARQALTGLTEQQLSTPVPPTTWAPIAALHHLALDVERWWFSAILAGDDGAWQYFDQHPGGAWYVPPGTDVLALYEAECASSDEVIARTGPSNPAARWPDSLGPPQTAGQIVLHVITETATHAGQLDVVREAIDGRRWLVLE